ncbi:MAG: carbon storage regulator [Planctomycetaceae bacterium]|jgi:carbon storage regulator|nr:carbon storage regulator [Planctomycetaceae bacterium]
MLVLSRKEGERIRIGEDVFVTVVHVAKDKVRIGVEAPFNTVILRDELRAKIPVVNDSDEAADKTEQNTDSKEQQTNIKLAS